MLKKRYLFLIIIICLFTISTVSAVNNSTTDVDSLEASSDISIINDNDTSKEVNKELLTTGNNWYVNGGVDTTGNGSEEFPFKTLKEAINNASTGNSVHNNNIDNIVTKDNFFDFFDTDGNYKQNLTELFFKGEFDSLVDAITINKPLTIQGLDASLKDMAFALLADNIVLNNFSLELSKASTSTDGSAILIHGMNNVIENILLNYSSTESSDAYSIYAKNVDNLTIIDNDFNFAGATNGTHINNVVHVSDSSNVVFKDNEVNTALVSCPIDWREIPPASGIWVKFPFSEGVVFNDCSNLTIANNNIKVEYTDFVGEYDTIYVVDVKDSSDVGIINNTIDANGHSYIYGLYVESDGLLVDNNNLVIKSDINYANGIEIETSHDAIISNNNITAIAPALAYPIYSGMIGGGLDVDYIDNVINATADIVYGMELCGNIENVIDNTIIVNGNQTTALAILSKKANISDNFISALGLNLNNASTVEIFTPMTVAIHLINSTTTIGSNMIASSSSGILAEKGTLVIVDNNITCEGNTNGSTKNIAIYLIDCTRAELCNNSFNITVNPTPELTKKNVTINATTDHITVGENATINITGLENATGNITAKIKNNIYHAPIVNGTATFTVSNLTSSTTIYIFYEGDDNYNPVNTTVDIIVYPKSDVIIVAENITKYYGGPESFIVKIYDSKNKPIANKTVKITINGITYNRTTDAKGIASLAIRLSNGTYNVTITVDNTTVKSNVTVLSTIIGFDLTTYYKNQTQYSVKVYDTKGKPVGKNEIVTFNVNGIFYNRTTDEKGIATLNIKLPPSDYIITADYKGCKISNKIKVLPDSKKNLTLKATSNSITFGENATINITGLEKATGNITITVNKKNYTAPIKDGNATVIVSNLSEGIFTANVTYTGDDKYNNASTTVDIIVNSASKKNLTINATSNPITVGENATIIVTGFKNATGNVTARIGSSSYHAPIVNSTATFVVPDVKLNTTARIYYKGDDNYNPAITTVDIIVYPKSKVIIVAENITKYYGGPESFIVKIYDSKNKPIANKTVKITINGITYNRTTDAKGIASLAIRLSNGTYNVTTIVDNTTVKSRVTVLSTIIGFDLIKYYKNQTQYSVKVYDTKGKPVGKNEIVTFNVNGIFYKRITDENGIATLNINLPQSDYIITADYKGCKISNKIKVLPVLNAKDIIMNYLDGTQFKANLIDGQGKPYKNQMVTFNINGIFYNRLTDSNGQAALNIRLPAGEYIITSSFNGANIANKITITG